MSPPDPVVCVVSVDSKVVSWSVVDNILVVGLKVLNAVDPFVVEV